MKRERWQNIIQNDQRQENEFSFNNDKRLLLVAYDENFKQAEQY